MVQLRWRVLSVVLPVIGLAIALLAAQPSSLAAWYQAETTATSTASAVVADYAWTQLTANGAAGSPPLRGAPAVAWDSQSNRVLVFGGTSGQGARYDDLWQYTAAGG
ncbi:MAG: hypothetical protein HY329_21915 [Chloroflexi bacterium]|nr:hypothetical protein [Chloroflexota bacterium]